MPSFDYILGAFILLMAAAYWTFLWFAPKLKWYDQPNERSSHTRVTLHGAGVVFLLAVIFAYAVGYLTGWSAIGIIFAGLVGLAADHAFMPPLHRLVLYAIAWVLVFSGQAFFQLPLLWLLPAFLICLGWINFFNFMDGINGMMTLYTLVALASIWYQLTPPNTWQSFIELIILAVAGYGILNVRRKALAFAGDIGSVSIAFILAILMLVLIGETLQWGYLLFFSLYFADAGFTMVFRILNKENLFEPHRKHLYQFLANEMEIPHVKVALGYALLQALINIGVILLQHNAMLTTTAIIVLAGFIAVIYLVVRYRVVSQIPAQP